MLSLHAIRDGLRGDSPARVPPDCAPQKQNNDAPYPLLKIIEA
ncbi:hypothetical protein [Burkholderia sp. FERM BP-3421]|nr:hypothetical protein [Burkholderia sp. FERM BP-3421]